MVDTHVPFPQGQFQTPKNVICPNGNEGLVSKEWSPESVFELLASEETRTILAAASVRPVSAEELCDLTEVSLPTVYRRVNALIEYGFLSAEQTVGPDGRQFKRYETDLREINVLVEDGGFNVNIGLRKDAVDRFGELWDDLERGRDNDDVPIDTDDISIGSDRQPSNTDFRGSDS